MPRFLRVLATPSTLQTQVSDCAQHPADIKVSTWSEITCDGCSEQSYSGDMPEVQCFTGGEPSPSPAAAEASPSPSSPPSVTEPGGDDDASGSGIESSSSGAPVDGEDDGPPYMCGSGLHTNRAGRVRSISTLYAGQGQPDPYPNPKS